MNGILAFATAALGYLLSIVFEFFPGLAAWHERLSPKRKALLHATLSFLLGLLALYVSCIDSIAGPLGLTCTPFNTENVILLVMTAYGGNQLSYNTAIKWRSKGDGAKG